MPRSFLLKRGMEELSTREDHPRQGNERKRSRSKLLRISIEGQKGRHGKQQHSDFARSSFVSPSADELKLDIGKSIDGNFDDQLESKLDVLIRAAQQIMKHDNTKLTMELGEYRVESSNVPSIGIVKKTPDEDDSRLSDVDGQDDSDDASETSCENDGKAKYECSQCGRQFKTRYTLTIHQRMPDHTRSRPFVCNVCGKGFRLSSTLCRHKIIHTEEKPHKCKTCHKAFNRSSTLKTHLKTHSPVKEFNCDVCGKGFHQKGNLRNHVLIHTGEKPYKCSLCDRAFNKLSNLKFHLQTHDQSKHFAYHCSICDCPFEKKITLNEHMQLAH